MISTSSLMVPNSRPFERISVIKFQRMCKERLVIIPARKKNIGCLMRRDHEDESRRSMVDDESMLILRRRIQEIKVADKNHEEEEEEEEEPPAEWMWWEKQVYGDYDAFICGVMGMLQSRLMETRPAAVLALSAILVLSLPISAVTIMFHLARLLIFTPAAGAGLHL